MNLKINYTFEQKIWYSLFYEHYIILELRDEIKRTVRYTCINLLENTISWENVEVKATWWLGMTNVANGHVCIAEYETGDKPMVKKRYWITIATGEINPMIELLEEEKITDSIFSKVQRPVHYTEDNPYFAVIFNFLYRLLRFEAQKAVDYLEVGDKIIISYYIYHQNLLLNYLLVTNRKREVLLNKLIATSEGIGIDTFVVSAGLLLHVGNKNQLLGYEIEP